MPKVRRLAVVTLVACNQVYGLEPTTFPVDAPPACPSIGTQPPFSKALRQATLQDCDWYNSSSTGLAVAMCRDSFMSYLAEGPTAANDGEAVEMVKLPITGVSDPRISPEADELLVRQGLTRLAVYRRNAANEWAPHHDVAVTLTSNDMVSTITRGPTRRMVIATNGATDLPEYAIEPDGAVRMVAMHPVSSELAVSGLQFANLSADGLRLVFYSVTTMSDGYRQFYADRASIDDPFSAARPIENFPANIAFAYLTDDCARLYFSALGTVFYMPQR